MNIQIKNNYTLEPHFYDIKEIDLSQQFDTIGQVSLQQLASERLSYGNGHTCDYLIACVRHHDGRCDVWDAGHFDIYQLSKQKNKDPITRAKIEEVAYYILNLSAGQFQRVASDNKDFLFLLTQVNNIDSLAEATTAEELERGAPRLPKEVKAKYLAQVALAYSNGKKVKKDIWMARRYFQRAIESGYQPATSHLRALRHQNATQELSPEQKSDNWILASLLDDLIHR